MSIPFTPHLYQKRAIKFLLSQQCGALFLDPGLGKTSICLSAGRVLFNQGMIKRILVIAPLRVAHSVWPSEVEKWRELEHLRVNVLHGKDKLKNLKRKDVDIDVINPEGLEWLLRVMPRQFMWDWLIVDESSKFKHSNGVRFKLLKGHLHRFKRRTILTGTPAPNGLLDLFGQMYIVDMGRTLGAFVTHYRQKYFMPCGYEGTDWEPKPGAEKKIYAALKPVTMRMDAEDYLDLPPLIENDVFVELPGEAAKQYLNMENMLMAKVDDGLVVAANLAVATMKCRQIANGGLYTDSERAHAAKLHDAKSDAVLDLIEEHGGKPVLVAYEFGHDLERLREVLNDPPFLGGGVSPKRGRQIEQDWNAGKLPVLLVHPKSVAHGLNLQAAGDAVIWHSLTFDLEEYEQLIRRLWRQGRMTRVVVHRIIALGTVDHAVVAALRHKAQVQNRLLDALRAHLRLARGTPAPTRGRVAAPGRAPAVRPGASLPATRRKLRP